MTSDKDDTMIDLSNLHKDESSGSEGDDMRATPFDGIADEEFKIHHLDSAEDKSLVPDNMGRFEAVHDDGEVASGPASKVRVKFDKFITLVATHTYEDILRKNADEDVVISTNLLTDLANAHEENDSSSKKVPMLFVVGLFIGVVVTWLILRT
jgi:hypothetical protein